jgi:outer membrane protein assembly factor BamB
VTRHNVNAADPLVSGNLLFITSGYARGCALISVAGGRPRLLWEKDAMASHFSSPVVIDGKIYGVDGQSNKRQSTVNFLDLKTGAVAWSEQTGHAALTAADGKLIILDERGTLIIAKADPRSFREIARAKVLEVPRGSVCWTAPVLCGGRIYCRCSNGDLVCVDVRK